MTKLYYFFKNKSESLGFFRIFSHLSLILTRFSCFTWNIFRIFKKKWRERPIYQLLPKSTYFLSFIQHPERWSQGVVTTITIGYLFDHHFFSSIIWQYFSRCITNCLKHPLITLFAPLALPNS